jgi:hypothetical protein
VETVSVGFVDSTAIKDVAGTEAADSIHLSA